ncbi:hypothetical protein Rhe02_11650 [Rhizocola hellebori]|uniref:Asp23/Gls24 family envelope stress response protein n=1 Tax=Rhizocola hellebori TaxID=1392758 RepID=A0A8J3Q4C2_9ACTN|nr:Asp23/Gls24 family envelope stress response protein [Rhizocola hellebori]GIH03098.1 hypothetical protein Rhe02_11650 [Rhizocola hellebori]
MTVFTERPAQDAWTPELGVIRISEQAIAKVAARAATELPDVGGPARGLARMPGGDMLSGGGADLHRQPKVVAHLDEGQIHLDLVVSVRWPASVLQVSASLSEHLRQRMQQLTGLQVGEVRVAVADLVTETVPAARVR